MSPLHTVQFFDGPESLGRNVAAFMVEGIAEGEHLMLVARAAHVEAIADAMALSGLLLRELVASGQMTVIDAATVLRRLMFNGRPSADAFERTVAGLVRRQATRTNGKLRVYGELVDLLACDDNLRASDELELLWLELLREWPVRLHCGYTGATFANERTAPVMRRICERHDAVQRCDTDLLANWLLTQNT